MGKLPFPDPPLHAAGLRLRPWREDDLRAVARACADPLIAKFIPMIPAPYTFEDARIWFAGLEPERLAGRELSLAIANAETNAVLGSIGVRIDQRNRSASIGYYLALEARGHGHMTVAARLLCAWLFDTRELGRIQLTTDPENLASQGVARRCGFQQEGLLRSHLVFVSTGTRRDSLLWSLLPGELIEA